MIPFHKIYAWLFKSFSIGEETKLVDRLLAQWYTKMMIIKRSWIFILYIFWIPLIIAGLSALSIWIAMTQLPENAAFLRFLIIGGNVMMTTILIISSLVYLVHFHRTHKKNDHIITDIPALRKELQEWDKHFITFFNWSLTNQWILGVIVILEFIFIASNFSRFNEHLLILGIDFFIIIAEIYCLSRYRKRMMDLEMDFNVVVQGKIFFINQRWLLSDTQTIESDKIKTIKSSFPNKLASFFNFGNIDILTEGDSGMMGSIGMFFVRNPVQVVNSIQILLGEIRSIPPKYRHTVESNNVIKVAGANTAPIAHENNEKNDERISLHTADTRGKIRDILR